MKNCISETHEYLKFQNLLQRLMRNLHVCSNRYALRQKLSISECHALFLLRGGKPVEMNKIKNNLFVSGAFATDIADRLVKNKLVLRERADEDRRKVTLILTDKGRNNLIRLEKYNKRMFESLFRGLEQKDKAIMEKGISILIDSLESGKL